MKEVVVLAVMSVKPGFYIAFFLSLFVFPFVGRQRATNGNTTKNLLVFEIDLILSRKQETALKQQGKTTKNKEKQAKTKKDKKMLSFFYPMVQRQMRSITNKMLENVEAFTVEHFMLEIQRYECLCNKFSRDFKDKYKKIYCWTKVG